MDVLSIMQHLTVAIIGAVFAERSGAATVPIIDIDGDAVRLDRSPQVLSTVGMNRPAAGRPQSRIEASVMLRLVLRKSLLPIGESSSE